MMALRWASLALALTLVGAPISSAETFHWEAKPEEAKQLAARTNRLVLIHFAATWNDRSQALEREVFSQSGFGRDLAANFVGVKLQFDYYPQTARHYGVQSVPTDVIITPQGQLVEKLDSPGTEAEYVAAMNRIAVYARTGQHPPLGIEGASQPTALTAAAAAVTQPTTAGNATGWLAPPPSTVLSSVQPGSAGAPAPRAVATGYSPAQQQQQQPRPQRGLPQISPENAPLCMDGYCPVTLYEKRNCWVPGDTRYGLQHRGRTYLFAGPAEMQRFQADPDRYAPVLSGNDPVLAVDHGQMVAGHRMYGYFCNDRVYLFASELTAQRFQANKARYAVADQPLRR